MLLKGIAALSLILAAVVCLFCDFALWMIPVLFIAFWLGLMVLAFAFLAIACAIVDQEKPQEHDSKCYRTIARLYIEALVSLFLIRVHPEGLEKVPKEGRFLLVCNHLFLADPALLLHVMPKSSWPSSPRRKTSPCSWLAPSCTRSCASPWAGRMTGPR